VTDTCWIEYLIMYEIVTAYCLGLLELMDYVVFLVFFMNVFLLL